jgi:hypothetical protein
LEGGIDGHFLAGSLAEGLCPLQLARVALHLEVLVALAPTEPENSGIVADKSYAFAWVGGPTAEVAGFDPVTATY